MFNETKVAEEYCWAITQAAGRSCCGRSGSSVLGCGFNLTICVPSWDFRTIRLVPDLPERNYCVSGGSVCTAALPNH